MSKRTPVNHVGETVRANNGLLMTIIAYKNDADIDVQFEDETVVKHRNYRAFKKGQIKHPDYISTTQQIIGETAVANNGMQMTIIQGRNRNDIDIQFENGTIVEHRTYKMFLKGLIKCPKNHIGETNTAKCGLKMKIIAYRKSKDIDVKFEDGIIVTNKSYSAFRRGDIGHPAYMACTDHINETTIATNGLKMTIIVYRNSKDIDVQFEDSVIVKHKCYTSFQRGTIKHPDYGKCTTHINESNYAKNGLKMTIVAYRNSKDLDIQFEDDVIVTHKGYSAFKAGSIAHPNRPLRGFPVTINHIKITGIAYQTEHGPNLFCKCTKCLKKDILTYDEIENHICESLEPR